MVIIQIQAINSYLLEKSRERDEVAYLASPLSGGGARMGRFEKICLLAINLGKKTPEDLASYVWETMYAHNPHVVAGGAIDDSEKHIKVLQEQAAIFLQETLPSIKFLKLFDIAD